MTQANITDTHRRHRQNTNQKRRRMSDALISIRSSSMLPDRSAKPASMNVKEHILQTPSTGVVVGAILPWVAWVLLGSPPTSLEQGVQLVATFATCNDYDEKHENFKHDQNACRSVCPGTRKRYVTRPRNCACTFCSILFS